VYAVEDIRTVVTAPYSCIVGCSGCESQCAAGAIKFPEMEQFLHTLRELRVQFGQ
jgi:NAD-dependent dihydropyrimidine dehydrogenase PreA subunit